MEYLKSKGKFWRHFKHWVSAPFIWGIILPIVIMDLFIEIYHRVCFPLYNIPYVERKEYIRIDRQRLKYLNCFQKIECAYCGYVNGFFGYITEIGACTEKYWCGLRHEQTIGFHEPLHHKEFLEYGDEEAFKQKYACDLGKK